MAGQPNNVGPWWLNQQTAEIIYSKTPPGNPRVGNVFLGFATKADAQAYLRQVDPSGKTGPGTLLTPPHGNLPNPLTGLRAIGDFFQRLTQANTWLRVGEVILGGALLIAALVKLASGTKAGKAAISAGKVAALA